MVNSEISLMNKFDLQIDQLDYKFIESCGNVKTLEKILLVLRSGEEGTFPDLIDFCERRLRELSPNNKLLNAVKTVLSYSDLSENERTEIRKDIENWSSEFKVEEMLERKNEEQSNVPPVRGTSLKINKKVQYAEKSKTMKGTPRSYSDWDKFNVEEELEKVENNKENLESPKILTNRNLDLQNHIPVVGLSQKERQYIADLERSKGNEAFKARDYEESILYYTRSLSAFKSTKTLNNRAQAYIKTKKFFAAVEDCTEVIGMEPNNVKALYRRGTAHKEVGLLDLAKLDFKNILELDSENKLAKDQLKQIKQLKSTKLEDKKVLIEEIKDEKIQTDRKNIEKLGTRLIIEEVTNNQKDLNLPELNYSSEEDDEAIQIPQKIKQMFNVKGTENKYTGPEIEKIHILKTNTKKSHNMIEECSESVVNANMLNEMNNEFVTIQIEECSEEKITEDGNTKDDQLIQENNKSTNTAETSNLNNLNASNSQICKITSETDCTYREYKDNLISNEKLKEVESKDQGLEINDWIQQNLNYNTDVTPYEFLCTWLSNAKGNSCFGAQYLLKVKPEELPNLISDKLDGQLLCELLKAIYYMYQTGKSQEGKKYLCYLTKVRRINIASLFLAEGEKECIHHLFLNLETDCREHMTYINKILQT